MRKYYIDNLRSIAVLLLIPYHAAMAWNTWGEPNYIFFESNRLLGSIVVFFSPFFMPLFFLAAGVGAFFALQKRTTAQYVAERCKRLLIPLVCGTLFLMPPMTYLADRFHGTYAGSFLGHYRIFFTRFTDLTGADGGFSVGQFWFLLYLFVISLLAAGIRTLLKKPTRFGKLPVWAIDLLGLPLPFLHELLSLGGKSFAEYAYLFLLGYFVFSDDDAVGQMEKYRWLFLSVGLTAAVLNVYLFVWSETPLPLLNSVLHFAAEWFMLLALFGLGKRYMHSHGRLSKYLSRRSVAFYVWHFIWIVLFQYLLADLCKGRALLLYALPVALSCGATLLCCELSVRVPLLRFLTGGKKSVDKSICM